MSAFRNPFVVANFALFAIVHWSGLSSVVQAEPNELEVKSWVEQLASSDFQVREASTENLIQSSLINSQNSANSGSISSPLALKFAKF